MRRLSGNIDGGMPVIGSLCGTKRTRTRACNVDNFICSRLHEWGYTERASRVVQADASPALTGV
jgi:hypothetical protein